MRRTKSELALHFVWATHQRGLFITPQAEAAIYGCILREAAQLECDVLALGGMPDHVHLLLEMPPKHAPAKLMQRIKGISSTLARTTILPGEPFAWQEHYGVFCVCKGYKARVVDYIRRQKQHHADGTLWTALEQTEQLDENHRQAVGPINDPA